MTSNKQFYQTLLSVVVIGFRENIVRNLRILHTSGFYIRHTSAECRLSIDFKALDAADHVVKSIIRLILEHTTNSTEAMTIDS